MAPKRKLFELPESQLSHEPPVMSTRSRRVRTATSPHPQRQSKTVANSFETKKPGKIVAAKTARAIKRTTSSKKETAIAAEQSMPSPSLTPSLTPPFEVEHPLTPKSRIRHRLNTAKTLSPHSGMSPKSTPPQDRQQQHTSEQKITRKRKAAQAFLTHLTNPDSGNFDPYLSPPQSRQQEPRKKKQKTSPDRPAAKSNSSKSADRDLDSNLTTVLFHPDQSKQQELRSAKQMTARKRVAKAVPLASLMASLENEDIALLSPAGHVAKFWMDQCRKVFSENDGYEVTIHSLGDTGDQSKQQVFVWEKEFYDEAMLSKPSLKIPASKFDPGDKFKLPDPSSKSADGTRSWTVKNCDFLQKGTVQPPATMKEYARCAKKLGTEFELRDIPILVIECRGADGDHDHEWCDPGSHTLSRSYAPSPQSQIQKALIEKIYTFDDVKVKYEPARGWLTQEQCFCATAIGDKIKFWKHVSPYPHLKPWSGILDKTRNEDVFIKSVSKKLAEAKEDGFEFAMEWDGRKTFASA